MRTMVEGGRRKPLPFSLDRSAVSFIAPPPKRGEGLGWGREADDVRLANKDSSRPQTRPAPHPTLPHEGGGIARCNPHSWRNPSLSAPG